MANRITRRGFLAFGAAFSLVGCTTAYENNAAIPIIRSVQVSGDLNLWIVTIGPYVQRALIQQMGNRYQPNARDGATLQVQLTGISFPDSGGGGIGFGFDSSDVLEGKIALLSPSGQVLKHFPLLSSVVSVDAAAEFPAPTPRRYDWSASSFAHWTLSKLV